MDGFHPLSFIPVFGCYLYHRLPDVQGLAVVDFEALVVSRFFLETYFIFPRTYFRWLPSSFLYLQFLGIICITGTFVWAFAVV